MTPDELDTIYQLVIYMIYPLVMVSLFIAIVIIVSYNLYWFFLFLKESEKIQKMRKEQDERGFHEFKKPL